MIAKKKKEYEEKVRFYAVVNISITLCGEQLLEENKNVKYKWDE